MRQNRNHVVRAGLRAAILAGVAILLALTGWAQAPVPVQPKPMPVQAKPIAPPPVPLSRGGETAYPANRAQAAAPAAPTFKPGEAPKIVFDKTDEDVGTIAEGQKAKFKFPFKNAGKSDLEILEVRKTCGCTLAESTKKLLKPGESAEIDGEIDTTNRSGKQMKTVHVKSNDPDNKEVTLKIEMTVRKEIDVNPPNVHFPVLDIGAPGKQEVRITNTGEKPLRITGIKSSNEERVTAKIVSPAAEGKPGESAPVKGESQPIVLEVDVAPSQQVGNFNAMLTVDTDNPAKQNFQIYASGKVAGDLEVYPVNIFFGLLRDSQATTRTCTLVSRAGIPFKITQVNVTGAPLKVKYEPMEGKEGYRFQIGLDGKMEEGQNRGTITVETTHPKQKTVEIGVTAFVRKVENAARR